MKINKRPYFIFYMLSVYILMQFSWWSYVLVRLNKDLKETVSQSTSSVSELALIEQNYEHKLWMITGEGFIFFIFLISGIVIVLKSLKKEERNAQIQTDFLLSTSHELKTPIAIIQLYLETLEKRELNEEQKKEILSNAQKETRRLGMLTENILLTTRIEQSEDLIVKQRVDISELLNTIIADIKRSIGLGRRIVTRLKPEVRMMVDSVAFESIFNNLIENAIKYTEDSEEISIILKEKDGNVIIEVNDEGPGISDKEKAFVFNKFYRIGREHTRKTKGTGLGLYLVKQLVVMHDGSIEIIDNKPKGTSFQVVLPKE